ncbi:glycerol-3-phosphate 1-O-acyltransferase PlsY [Desulfovibrio mangrovi]|uniref:glycerol-3-phosphate 1-O-acyltransferase PlsY n=1 Tax=Desulfovibrio mangrovi TaxID=2976983 RepID=UPI0022469E20|nr:glycerol-3-phosphate 1-O-acyltransferase PlsY [Desulfovibrio mangrovi]UZP66278.1 glycerol-3-phosphate 1-O-acyltransferase PlsY [Desulfovibrio mangrovi]
MLGIILWLLIAYMVGSIPFGLLIAKSACGIDPRSGGSRNVGATNVARLCGTRWGIATLTCDLLKGALPVWIGMVVSDHPLFLSCVALAALGGHVYSMFLDFKGGKAVATTIGIFIPLAFKSILLAAIACALVIWRSGYVSLGSLTLVTVMPLLLFLGGSWSYIPLSLVVMAFVYWTHRENIGRLARGEEKAWQKKKHEEQA